jgi:hypothetical protein
VSITLLLVIIGGAFAWVLVESLINKDKDDETAPAAPGGARAGRPPTPTARIVIVPGVRLIDLRSFPRDDLRVGNIDVAREQIGLEAVMPVQIWVIDAETFAAWLELDSMLFLVAGRLKDRRAPTAKNFLHVVGAQPDAAACAKFESAGIEVALSMTNLGDPPRELEAFLDPPEPWVASPEDRPINPSKVITTTPFDDYIHVVGDFTFVDLRRAPPEALRNGVALGRIEEAFAVLATMPPPRLLVWVLAPWVLAELPADTAPRVRALLPKVRPTLGHRLAVVTGAGETASGHPVTTALLEGGASGLQEAYYLKTDKRGAFQVPPITALHDTYFHHAWKHPRL